jgi:hypothetical protein
VLLTCTHHLKRERERIQNSVINFVSVKEEGRIFSLFASGIKRERERERERENDLLRRGLNDFVIV